MIKSCFCGSGRQYKDCCAIYHQGIGLPDTPESLMRSRFSAFAGGHIDYLIASLHPDKVTDRLKHELRLSQDKIHWLSLRVLDAHTEVNDSVGWVEFIAFYQAKSDEPRPLVSQLHEKSRFVRENGRWFYLDGTILPDINLGRNDLCWCGSGKKVKKCHPN